MKSTQKDFHTPAAVAMKLATMFCDQYSPEEMRADYKADECVFGEDDTFQKVFGNRESYMEEIKKAWANRNKEPMTNSKIKKGESVEIDEGTYKTLQEMAAANERSVAEELTALIRAGRLASDGENAGKTSGDDPDNLDGRRKADRTQAAAKLRPLTREERMEIDGQIQSLAFSGRGDAALDLQKVSAVYNREEAKQNAPSIEEQNKSFVDSIVRNGTKFFNGGKE
jgi:hypothetical protein